MPTYKLDVPNHYRSRLERYPGPYPRHIVGPACLAGTQIRRRAMDARMAIAVLDGRSRSSRSPLFRRVGPVRIATSDENGSLLAFVACTVFGRNLARFLRGHASLIGVSRSFLDYLHTRTTPVPSFVIDPSHTPPHQAVVRSGATQGL